MNDLISVIVPVYNVKEYLDRCVLSICAQTHKNLEIILVDDGSDDGSGEMCDQLARKDDRIVVVHQENGGSTSARNAGLEISKGAFIGFVDSDDWIEPEMYETLIRLLTKNGADISVIRQYLDFGETSHREGVRSFEDGTITNESGIMPHHVIYSDDFSKRGVSPNLFDKLFSRRLIERHQKNVDPNTRFAEDDLCVYSCLLDAKRVSFANIPMYHYCRHQSSVTHRGDSTYFEKINLFYRQMKEEFSGHEQAKLLIKKLDVYMLEFIMRGVNWQFGFSFGRVLPFFIPPYDLLSRINIRRIALYGAGDVGKDYYRTLCIQGQYEIVLWVDQNWEIYHGEGMDVRQPELLKDQSLYDVVLIATDSGYLAEEIRRKLVSEYKIDSSVVVYQPPIKFIETVGDELK